MAELQFRTMNEFRNDIRYQTQYLHLDPAVADAAEERAKDLLFSALDEQQRRSYRLRHGFEIKGQHNRYFVRAGGVVECLKPKGQFCVYLRSGYLPVADRALAMKLYIESDEEAFLREANFSDGRHSLVKLKLDGTIEPSVPDGFIRFYPAEIDPTFRFAFTSTVNFQTTGTFQITTPVLTGTMTQDMVETTTIGDATRTFTSVYLWEEY